MASNNPPKSTKRVPPNTLPTKKSTDTAITDKHQIFLGWANLIPAFSALAVLINRFNLQSHQQTLLEYEKTPILDVVYSSCPIRFAESILDNISLVPSGLSALHKINIESHNALCLGIYASPPNLSGPLSCDRSPQDTYWFATAASPVTYYLLIVPNGTKTLDYKISYEYKNRYDGKSLGGGSRSCSYNLTDTRYYILTNQSGWIFEN